MARTRGFDLTLFSSNTRPAFLSRELIVLLELVYSSSCLCRCTTQREMKRCAFLRSCYCRTNASSRSSSTKPVPATFCQQSKASVCEGSTYHIHGLSTLDAIARAPGGYLIIVDHPRGVSIELAPRQVPRVVPGQRDILHADNTSARRPQLRRVAFDRRKIASSVGEHTGRGGYTSFSQRLLFLRKTAAGTRGLVVGRR